VFAIYKEKQLKFDRLVKEFPTSLMTPVDANYLKKIVRRARQNKHKRSKTAALKQKTDGDTVKDEPKSEPEPESEEEEKEEEPQGRTVNIPTMGKKFPTVKYNSLDFGV
jgi:Skp family chaperone for outer membrane proteins